MDAIIGCIRCKLSKVSSLKKFAFRIVGIGNFFAKIRSHLPSLKVETSPKEDRSNSGLWNITWLIQSDTLSLIIQRVTYLIVARQLHRIGRVSMGSISKSVQF